MNIEQMHMDVLETTVSFVDWRFSDTGKAAASKSAEITEQIAIEFAEWIADSKKHGWSKQLYEAMIVNKVKTTKELFQEFLKTKQ